MNLSQVPQIDPEATALARDIEQLATAYDWRNSPLPNLPRLLRNADDFVAKLTKRAGGVLTPNTSPDGLGPSRTSPPGEHAAQWAALRDELQGLVAQVQKTTPKRHEGLAHDLNDLSRRAHGATGVTPDR